MVKRDEILSPLETLPNDLLKEIMWRVESHSREDLHSFMLTTKDFFLSGDDPKNFKTLSFPDLVSQPLLVQTIFKNVFHQCLRHSNPSAQYIHGILQYFVNDNSVDGLSYLKQAADASVDEAIYLYGIINLARGDFIEGSRYMEQLKWRDNTKHAEDCWKNVKASLSGIKITKKQVYFRSLNNMEPEGSCSIYAVYRACPNCYFYKQLARFLSKI